MGTQAVVSLTVRDEVLVKVIAGCDGARARELGQVITNLKVFDRDSIFDAARRVGLGCHQCLVVMDQDDVRYDGDEPLDELYRNTFDDPNFNPRWESGLADIVLVLDVEGISALSTPAALV